MNETYHIYKFKNLVNHKIYIAMSKKDYENFIWLQKVQITNYESNRGTQAHYISILSEFGLDNFEIVEIAAVKDKKIASHLKKMFINKYQSNDEEYGYNRQQGRPSKVSDVG